MIAQYVKSLSPKISFDKGKQKKMEAVVSIESSGEISKSGIVEICVPFRFFLCIRLGLQLTIILIIVIILLLLIE